MRVIPIEMDVTGMSLDEIVLRFGEVYGFKKEGDRILAQVGYIMVGV